MQTCRLGSQGLTVSAQGLGCMGMAEFYGPTDEAESLATIRPRAGARRDLPRYRGHVRPPYQRGVRRAGHRRAAR